MIEHKDNITLQQISIFQRTKAIHNAIAMNAHAWNVVANINLSKNKSNSQRKSTKKMGRVSCSKYQSFKEQKQFTTAFRYFYGGRPLQQISIFQRTKAIHNGRAKIMSDWDVVANINLSKNKSNSQLLTII